MIISYYIIRALHSVLDGEVEDLVLALKFGLWSNQEGKKITHQKLVDNDYMLN